MRLQNTVRRQDGVISRAQAVACGLSVRTVQRRVASGAWVDVLPGVSLVDGHALTDRARVRAAWLWAGPSATVSGPAAGFWHGLLEHASGPVQVTVSRSVTRRSVGWVQVRRRDLAALDRTVRNGVGVTALPLTVLETAVAWPDGAAVLDRALQQKKVRFGDLHEAYCRSAGAYGMARAAMLLREAGVGAASVFERRLVRLLRRAGISGFVLGHPFGRDEIDLAFPAQRVAVELDGWAWHTDRDRFQADRSKGNALVRAGWIVLRFTWDDLTRRPHDVVAQIRSALRQRSATDLSRSAAEAVIYSQPRPLNPTYRPTPSSSIRPSANQYP